MRALSSRLLQWVMPHHLLSRLIYRLTRCAWPPWKNTLIRLFVGKYKVDLSQAERPAIHAYESFNDFFTRTPRPGARPVARTGKGLTAPVDGAVGAAGVIEDLQMFQAKGREYTLVELLDGDEEQVRLFRNGNFMTLYLSPRDYHRVHIPIDGELQYMAYIPGRLFSVNPNNTHRIDKLFVRNERVITIFRTAIGRVAVIFIGAIFVGAMTTVWHGQVTPSRTRKYACWNYEPGIAFAQGEEIGRFNMGSSLILLTEAHRISWLVSGGHIVMGQRIAVGCE